MSNHGNIHPYNVTIKDGRRYVNIRIDKRTKQVPVARLVYHTFVSTYNTSDSIYHLDQVKHHDHLSNLVALPKPLHFKVHRCTGYDPLLPSKHLYTPPTLQIKEYPSPYPSTSVFRYSPFTGKYTHYPTIESAFIACGVHPVRIRTCIRGMEMDEYHTFRVSKDWGV